MTKHQSTELDIKNNNKHVQKTQTCPICDGQRQTPWFEKKGYHVVRCKVCSFVFVNPRPTLEELIQHYDQNYFIATESGQKNVVDAMGCKLGATKNMNLIAKNCTLPKNPVMLDIGCGMGVLMSEAKERGFTVHGVDMSPASFKICQERGLDVHLGSFEGLKQINYFDVITATDVLEHVLDPNLLVKKVFDLLKPGGYVLFVVPNVNGFGVKKLGPDWQCFLLPDHLNYFKKETAVSLLKRHQFKPILVFSEPSFTLSLRNHLAQVKDPYWQPKLAMLRQLIGQFKLYIFYPFFNWFYKVSGWDANNLVILAQKPQDGEST